MWQKLTSCAFALSVLTGPAFASADSRPIVLEQKRTEPVLVNTERDLQIARRDRQGYPTSSKKRAVLTQKDTLTLPPYVNRKGEVSLVGPSGLIEESSLIHVDLRPDSGHLVSIRMAW